MPAKAGTPSQQVAPAGLDTGFRRYGAYGKSASLQESDY
jgi:hypothetical protein